MTNDAKPIMLYDGDCGFCRSWIERWSKMTGAHVAYEEYQKALARYPGLSEERCSQAVQLVMPDGSVFSGAHAVFKALAVSGRLAFLLWGYEKMPLFGNISERIYGFIAHRRSLLSKLYRAPVCKI